MASSKAQTVAEYLASLPDDRRAGIAAVRRVIVENLHRGYEESMQYGMIGYSVPLSRFPETYNGHPLMFAALASQKGHMAVYLTNVYGDPGTQKWFVSEYKKSGKRLDMGKSCVRFRTLDDLPLDLIGKTIARCDVETFLARYEKNRAATPSGKTKKR